MESEDEKCEVNQGVEHIWLSASAEPARREYDDANAASEHAAECRAKEGVFSHRPTFFRQTFALCAARSSNRSASATSPLASARAASTRNVRGQASALYARSACSTS